MTLQLASSIKYISRTSEERAELEKSIELLNGHISFADNVAPPVIDDGTKRARAQFQVFWRNEMVQIKPVGGKLPAYELSSVGRDGVERMLNVYDTPVYAGISLRTNLQERYRHYCLYRNPE